MNMKKIITNISTPLALGLSFLAISIYFSTSHSETKNKDNKTEIIQYLKQQVGAENIGNISDSPIEGIHQVKIGPDFAYITKDGRYLFTGELIDLKAQENWTKKQAAIEVAKQLKEFPESDMVIYKAENEEKSQVTIFTDTTCPYCTKLHAEVADLQKAGVTVRYIAFPRAGLEGSTYKIMKAVWCAENQQEALTIAKGLVDGKTEAALDMKSCDKAKAVDNGYEFGRKIGITGTPAIVLPDGDLIAGYIPGSQLLQRLNIQE